MTLRYRNAEIEKLYNHRLLCHKAISTIKTYKIKHTFKTTHSMSKY